MRRTSLKSTGFKPRTPRREQRDPDRVRSVPTVSDGAWRTPRAVDAMPAVQVPKDAPVRSEAYRRAVAGLPCIACGIQGYSQAAHLPPEAKGMKQSDLLTFPLCCTRVGIPGCHQDYDQYRLFPRDAAMTVGRAWAVDTQRRIKAMGMWPNNLQFPEQTNDSKELAAINSVVK